MNKRPVLLSLLAVSGLLAACLPTPLPTLTEAPRPAMVDFSDDPPNAPALVAPIPSSASSTATTAPSAGIPPTLGPVVGPSVGILPILGPVGPLPSALPAGASPAPITPDDPFNDPRLVNHETATRFSPAFSYAFADHLRVGSEPGISTDIYQTSEQIEVRELRILVEKASFRFDKLTEGLEIGGGRMDIGTPPKLTLTVSIKVIESDRRSYGVFSVKASYPLATVYLADMRIKQRNGNLSIVNIANLARSNDARGVFKTERSARVIQSISPGYVVVPNSVGPMRSQVLIYSEADPVDGQIAIRTFNQTVGIDP